MPVVEVTNTSPRFQTYRAERTRSMFNVTDDQGASVTIRANLEYDDWPAPFKIGLIVGPSGSGKTTIGRAVFDDPSLLHMPGEPGDWPHDAPIVEAISPDADYDAVTGALSAVGLGDVPSWMRPFHVLSTGEKFRADLARIVCEAPERIVIDEFTSVVDRQIAKVGASAFAKTWRRTGGQAVLLSCHYDIVDWLAPDWVFDTATGEFSDTRECLQRPKINVDIHDTAWNYWKVFKPHHYLDSGPMPFGTAYTAFIDGAPVAHVGMSSKNIQTKSGNRVEARACRMVVMPEWQGAGVGMRFLNHLCQENLEGRGHLKRRSTTQFHTSHPGLVAALRRDRRWKQVSAIVAGDSQARSRRDLAKSGYSTPGFGGHLRAVQGFRYHGNPT